MGRDVGRDEGRDQAAWRDLVARLELTPSIDPADAPWPDRENLPAKPTSGSAKSLSSSDVGSSDSASATDASATDASATDASATDASEAADSADSVGESDELAETGAPTALIEQADPQVKQAEPDGKGDGEPASQSGSESGSETKPGSRSGRRPPASRSRIIRPAGYSRFGRAIPRQPGPSAHPEDQDAEGPMRPFGSPRDFELADDTDFDFDDGDRYIPPPLPPLGRVDPVVAGAWTALFGGPAFLLISMLTGWQAPRWTALIAVLAFVAGFIVLVFRLGDGPSKRDGPDQGAVV